MLALVGPPFPASSLWLPSGEAPEKNTLARARCTRHTDARRFLVLISLSPGRLAGHAGPGPSGALL